MAADASTPPPPGEGDASDLSGLEATAARMGLGTRRARLVPPDRRTGRAFAWDGEELLVSERVVERLRPDEGEVLLIHAVHEARALGRARRTSLLLLGASGLLALAVSLRWPDAAWMAWTGAALVSAMGSALLWGRAAEAADDAALEDVGDPDRLVRTLNVMHQDEIHLGRWRGRARPDVHRRAERLVREHQLRLPPELRVVPGIDAGSDGGGSTPTPTRACDDERA